VFGFLKKRYETPVEARNYSKLYLVLSGILFLGTMYSIVDEVTVRRPWKEYQNAYRDTAIVRFTNKMNDAVAMFDSAGYLEAQKTYMEIETKLSSAEYRSAGEQLELVKEELVDASRDYTFAKSLGDEAYYFYQTAKKEGSADVEAKEKKLRGYEMEMDSLGKIVARMEARRDSLRNYIMSVDLEVKLAKGKVDVFFTDIEKWRTKVENAQEMLLEIKQVMLNDFERTNFGTVKARIDRCQTCHLGWRETEAMADAPQPFTAHPVPEILAQHNPEIYGCTTCHNGQGPALEAGTAHSKIGDHEEGDHYWEKTLLFNATYEINGEKYVGKEVYSSCATCHTQEVFLKNGGTYNRGRQMVLEVGCFGCHEIKGYTDVPKIAPELNQLSVKTTPEWTYRWVRNPKDYNPHTRMPNFKFGNDSAEAITAFLWDIAKDVQFDMVRNAGSGGNSERGKQVVNDVGCKGCHVVDGDERVRQMRGTSYDIAPELSRIGSKVNADWLYDWIRNPRHFRSSARMPSLRLTESEAKDVVAYLMTLKDDRTFEHREFALNDAKKIKFGEKLVREYGCHGCHDIRGMEKEGRVSVALSNFGRKRVDELDFGDTKFSHHEQSWDLWTYNKIKDARLFTTERIVSKMPVFSFADSEIVVLRTALRGMVKDTAEAIHQQAFTPQRAIIQTGRKLTVQYNCIGCHNLEDNGGYVKALFEDAGLAPPPITGEGAKVQEMWLHSFLNSPTTIRPWLNLRMPTFQLSDDEINIITKYFNGISKKEIEIRDYANAELKHEWLPAGKSLFDDNQCLSCHTTGTIPEGKEPSDLAPDLRLARTRLKPEWVIDWMRDPGLIQPGTRMPQFFPPDEKGKPTAIYTEYLDGDPVKQMIALRDYLWSIGKQLP